MAHMSKFVPQHPEKYLGAVENIICRSSWERRFCRYCDDTPGIVRWSSEEFHIPYWKPTDGQVHRYFPDFRIDVLTVGGTIKTFVIEIKPKAQTTPPKLRKRTKKFLSEAATYAVNQAKWAAATKYCQERGWSFMVLDETHLFGRVNAGR